MKKILPLVLIMLSTVTLYKCNQAEPDKLTELTEFPEVLMVKRSSFNSFYTDLTTFAQSLTSEQQALLDGYVATNSNSNASKVAPGPICNCLPGDGKCEASATFNSCCICCPKGRAYTCGVTLNIASCRCEDPPAAQSAENQAEQILAKEEDAVLIQINSRKINEMFNFASQQGINVSAIQKSLKTLVNSTN